MFILSKKDNTKQKFSNSQLELIKKMDSGLIFTCEFIKRSNQERRYIKARTQVKKGLKGVGAKYNFRDYNLLHCIDIDILQKTKDINKARKNISLDGLIWVKVQGKKYFWNDLAIDESINNIKELNKTILK